ncbi:hypothetical protein CPC08DRAFT_705693 [Agrocybe pediades]|nr:hypothetical protein CPC08DRAFT_705693 [Agrocybe pediades]
MDHQDDNCVCTVLGPLPPELLERVLIEAWVEAMTPSERKDFVKTFSRVSPVWEAILARITTIHVYYTDTAPRYLRRVGHARPLIYSEAESSGNPDHHIRRTVTRQIRCSTTYLSSQDRVARKANKELLSAFRLPFTLSFHARIIRLEVEYTFPSKMYVWILEALGLRGDFRDETEYLPWAPPELYHVSSPDRGHMTFVDFLKSCPHLEPAEGVRDNIEIRVLNSSEKFRSHWTVVHGPLFAPEVRENRKPNHKEASTSVLRGHALGLVFDFWKAEDVSQANKIPRKLAVFGRNHDLNCY